MTEREKSLAGDLYDTSDAELADRRELAHGLCTEYNLTKDGDKQKRAEILDVLLPHRAPGAYLQGPVYFDYGDNIYLGENFYANFHFTVLDCGKVKIGDNVMIGPNCSIYTAIHPMLPEERNYRFREDGTPYNIEFTKPVTIGNDCWICGSVTILGGVKIGDGCVIGAGSVVVKDIPAGTFAAGNPCKPMRPSTEKDRLFK